MFRWLHSLFTPPLQCLSVTEGSDAEFAGAADHVRRHQHKFNWLTWHRYWGEKYRWKSVTSAESEEWGEWVRDEHCGN